MPPSTPTSVAARALRNWLESSGMSQRALADKLGVAQPTIAGWIAGRYLPSLVSAAALQYISHGTVIAIHWTPPQTITRSRRRPSPRVGKRKMVSRDE